MSATSLTHVPDLTGKLKYLLHSRGGDMPGWRHRITTQRLLADALTELGTNTDEPTIARWKRPDDIPNLVHIAPKIARIFRCDEQSFRRDDLLTFIETTEGTAPSWHILVATAEIAGTIGPTPPPAQAIDPGLRPMQAYPDREQDENDRLPELGPGTRFDAVLPCPVVRLTDPAPGRLTVLLFSVDRDGSVRIHANKCNLRSDRRSHSLKRLGGWPLRSQCDGGTGACGCWRKHVDKDESGDEAGYVICRSLDLT